MMQSQNIVSTIPGKFLTKMPTIVVTREDIMVKELELKQGELIIGRDDDCDLTLNDHSISNRHAKIITLFNATYVKDLGSTNGTFVNGKQTKEHTLHDGDVVTVGKRYRILFEKDSEQSATGGDKTTVMSRDEMNRALSEFIQEEKQQKAGNVPPKSASIHSLSEQETPVPAEPSLGNACLRVMAGEHSGREMPLNRRRTRLSRSGITYAHVERSENGFNIKRDANAPADSTILLNEEPLSAQAIRLKPEDIINLNGILMAFQTD